MIDCPGVTENEVTVQGLPNCARVRIETVHMDERVFERDFHFDYMTEGYFDIRMDECVLENGVLLIVMRRTSPQLMRPRKVLHDAENQSVLVSVPQDGLSEAPMPTEDAARMGPDIFSMTDGQTDQCSVAHSLDFEHVSRPRVMPPSTAGSEWASS